MRSTSGCARAESDRRAAFRILYDLEWSDGRISRALGIAAQTVARWRKFHGLAAHNSIYGPKIDYLTAMELYVSGSSDGEIARNLGATQSGVTRWRQRHKLSPNFENNQLSMSQKRKGRKLLRLGATKRQVADDLGLRYTTAVKRMRRTMDPRDIRPTGVTNRTIRSRVLADTTIYPRIVNSIGRGVPSEVRQEATSEMYVAVLDGRLRSDLIESEAKSFRSRAFAACGSAYGPRSLDEQSDYGLTMLHRLSDPSALESIEDAVERAFGMDEE